jgi:hypothetical protein
MKLITRQALADSAADRWALQCKGGAWGNKLDTLEKLRALGESPLPDRVDMVIGNKSWTRTECQECGSENIDVVEVGQKPDYGSCTANICKYCLKTALAI